MRPTWGPPGSCRPQMGPMNLAIRVVICWGCNYWQSFESFEADFTPLHLRHRNLCSWVTPVYSGLLSYTTTICAVILSCWLKLICAVLAGKCNSFVLLMVTLLHARCFAVTKLLWWMFGYVFFYVVTGFMPWAHGVLSPHLNPPHPTPPHT